MRALFLVAGIAACAGRGVPHARFPDAPMQLADDADREQAIDRLWVMPRGPARDAVRAEVVAALARRLTDELEDDRASAAADLTFELAALWRDDPDAVGAGLAARVPLLHRLRALFAKQGAFEPTIATLVLLAEAEAPRRAEHLAELDEILRFADDLSDAEHGDDADAAEPIALLQQTVLAVPLPWLVDRYVTLLVQRQQVVAKLIAADHLPMRLVNAHHDVLHTAHRIANVLARAGRVAEISPRLATISGIGEDRELAIRAEILVDRPTPDAYEDLARALFGDKDTPDPAASLAVARAGLAQFPHDPGLLAEAGASAAALGRVDQPIAFYEAAVAAQHHDIDPTLALRLGRLYAQRIARLAQSGRPTAAVNAWQEASRYTDRAARSAPSEVWRQVAALGEASLGRGLVAQGQLADAERVLRGSIDRAPSADAFETLATIYYKTARLHIAVATVREGLEALGDQTSGDRYHRAKLERIAGDIARDSKLPRDAAALYDDARRLWNALGEDDYLPRSVAAERKLEIARIEYYLGDPDAPTESALKAIDIDPDSPTTNALAVAFLLEINHPQDAADAFHHGLGAEQLPDADKVYLALRVVGDAHRRGAQPDRIAVEYLQSRHGDLWYDLLAEAATRRLDFTALKAAATTAARRSELAFYGSVLGLDPAAKTPAGARAGLEQVVRAGMVMDIEFDLARQYLAP